MLDPRSSPSLPAPTNFPAGIRLAQPGDQDELFHLLSMAHAENGFGEMDSNVVSTVIQSAVDGKRIVMAVVPGPKGIEAVIGLQPDKPWQTKPQSGWHYSDLLTYVRPDCRRSRHFFKLMAFADWWANHSGIPVILHVVAKERLGPKLKAFGRHATQIGGSFRFEGA